MTGETIRPFEATRGVAKWMSQDFELARQYKQQGDKVGAVLAGLKGGATGILFVVTIPGDLLITPFFRRSERLESEKRQHPHEDII